LNIRNRRARRPGLGAFYATGCPPLAKDQGDLLVRLRGLAFLTDTSGTTDSIGGSARTSNDFVTELDFFVFLYEKYCCRADPRHYQTHRRSQGLHCGRFGFGYGARAAAGADLAISFFRNFFSALISAGLNYTITYDVKMGRSVNSVNYSDEFGYAFQVGMDFKLNDRFSLNLDVNKVFVDTDIIVNGGTINAKNTDLIPMPTERDSLTND
jgi:outer membrane protein